MRISLRTSGGRGEYELVGHHDAVQKSDLYGRRLHYEIAPDIVIDGRCVPRWAQAKPRLRLEKGGMHLHRVLANVLLLPRPIREIRRVASGADFLRDGTYVLKDVDIDVVDSTDDRATVRPTRLWLANRTGEAIPMDMPERMALVQSVWEQARTRTDRRSMLVQEHENAVTLDDLTKIEIAANKIRSAMRQEDDMLPALATALGTPVEAVEASPSVGPVPDTGVEDSTSFVEATVRQIAKWRKVADRGAPARRFSEQVLRAYNFKCIVMGIHLPKLPAVTVSPGTDAAHILPWARYNLNSVSNGLCLCKLCHWAFDNGVLRITPQQRGEYYVSVPDKVRQIAQRSGFDLGWLDRYQGVIPSENLPPTSSDWPSPEYLTALNKKICGE